MHFYYTNTDYLAKLSIFFYFSKYKCLFHKNLGKTLNPKSINVHFQYLTSKN